METATDNKQKQEEFWMALVNKYEKRNKALEQQILQAKMPQQGYISENLANESQISFKCDCNPSIEKNNEGSVFSLSSVDLQYMIQIKELLDQEKEMKQKIQMFQQNDDETAVFKECKCENTSDFSNDLIEENKRLTDELKDLKLEMKQCIEKIEGPITRQIEKEKNRNKSLENELLKMTRDAASLQQTLTSETEDLKNQLDGAYKELSTVSDVSTKLKDELSSKKRKCKELEEAIIDQKLAEAEVLKKFKNAQKANQEICPHAQPCPPCTPPPSPACPLSAPHPPCSCTCQCLLIKMLVTQEAAGDKSGALHDIGRRLTAALRNIDQCSCCQNYIPQDLKDTCKGIKEIVDLVGAQEPAEDIPKPEKPKQSIVKYEESQKAKRSIVKSEESQKNLEVECTCQTEEEQRKSTEIQAQPPTAEFQAEIGTDKVENAVSTEKLESVDAATTETTPETQEAIAEAGDATTEAGTGAAPDTKEAEADALETVTVSDGEKKSPDVICSALRSQLEKTCKALCSKASTGVKETEEGRIITEIDVHGEDLYAEVGAELLLREDGEDEGDTQVTTTITDSGTVEIITEGPTGIIETTMTYTDSGNVEILTEITEYEDETETAGLPSCATGALALEESTSGYATTMETQESGISQGTTSAFATDSAYSADISALSSKITDGTFQPHHRSEDELSEMPFQQPHYITSDHELEVNAEENIYLDKTKDIEADEIAQTRTEQFVADAPSAIIEDQLQIDLGSTTGDVLQSRSEKLEEGDKYMEPEISCKIQSKENLFEKEEEHKAVTSVKGLESIEEMENDQGQKDEELKKLQDVEEEERGGRRAIEEEQEELMEVEEEKRKLAQLEQDEESLNEDLQEIQDKEAEEEKEEEERKLLQQTEEESENQDIEFEDKHEDEEEALEDNIYQMENGESDELIKTKHEDEQQAEKSESETSIELQIEIEVEPADIETEDINAMQEEVQIVEADDKEFSCAMKPSKTEKDEGSEEEIPEQCMYRPEGIKSEDQRSTSVKSMSFSSAASSVEELKTVETTPEVPRMPVIEELEKLNVCELHSVKSVTPVEGASPKVSMEMPPASALPPADISNQLSLAEQPQRVIVEQISPSVDPDALKKDVAEVLNRANRNVLDALDDANKHVMDALEAANRDVNNALAALENLSITTRAIQESMIADRQPVSELPSSRPVIASKQPSGNKSEKEMECAKSTGVDCKTACAEYMKEQFKILAESTAAARAIVDKEAETETKKPPSAAKADVTEEKLSELQMQSDVITTERDEEATEDITQGELVTEEPSTGEQAPEDQLQTDDNVAIPLDDEAIEDVVSQHDEAGQEAEDSFFETSDYVDTVARAEVFADADITDDDQWFDESEFFDTTRVDDDTAIVVKHPEDDLEEVPIALQEEGDLEKLEELEDEIVGVPIEDVQSIEHIDEDTIVSYAQEEQTEAETIQDYEKHKEIMEEPIQDKNTDLTETQTQKESETKLEPDLEAISRASAVFKEHLKDFEATFDQMSDQQPQELQEESENVTMTDEVVSSFYKSESDEIDEGPRMQRRKSSEERKIKLKKRDSEESKTGSEESRRMSQRKSSLKRESGDVRTEIEDTSLRRVSQEKSQRRGSTGSDVPSEDKQKLRRRSQDKYGQRGSKDEERQRPCSEGSATREKVDKSLRKCECPDDSCECEICAPEKMAARMKRQKMGHKKQDDCTCLPDCQCAICSTLNREKEKRLPSGDQADKEVQKGRSTTEYPSKEKLQPSEKCHPPDCDCISCLCDPCKVKPSRVLCHAKNCRCDECLCKIDALTDKSRHPPECYCLDCLCEICPSLQKFQELAKCEATCFTTNIDIDTEIGIKAEKQPKILATIDEVEALENQVTVKATVKEEEKDDEIKMNEVHPEDCVCPICQCPGADLVSVHRKHDGDCECPECKCEKCPAGVDVQTSDVTPTSHQKPEVEIMADGILQQKLLEMEDENRQRKQEMNELKRLLDQIRCACSAVDNNSPRSLAQKVALETTMSGLQTTLANLQEKCKAKDQMIEALTQELKVRANSKVFNDMLKNIATAGTPNVDYDRLEICATLPRPKESYTYGRPSHRLQKCEHPEFPHCLCVSAPPPPPAPECSCPEKEKEIVLPCQDQPNKKEDCTPNPTQSNKLKPSCNNDSAVKGSLCAATGDSADSKMPEDMCLCSQGGIYVDPSPLKITEVRHVPPDSLMLKWLPSQNKLVVGYEIDVNGILKSRVHSTNRTSAIVHNLIFNGNMEIQLFAVSKNGRCLPPAHALFELCT